jgi:hypothetical protein
VESQTSYMPTGFMSRARDTFLQKLRIEVFTPGRWGFISSHRISTFHQVSCSLQAFSKSTTASRWTILANFPITQGREGVVIVKTKMAILIAHYKDGMVAGNTATTVEQLADYLIKTGY